VKFIASILVFIVYVLFEIGLITYKPVLILNLLLILSLGLLHGSNDLAIYKQVTGTKWKFLMINYGIVALIFILSYLIAPLLCLILFVLVSAYHFGQELYEAEGLKSTLIENLILGILIFLLMFTFNVEEFNQVFDNLTSFQVSEITLVILSVCFSVAHLILMAVKIKKTGVTYNEV